MVNYNEGKIYKICNTEDNEVYIGSTTLPLYKRLYYHRNASSQERKYVGPIYQHMRKLGSDKFYIELIEHYPCSNSSMLKAREGTFIRELGTLNSRIAGRSPKEYYAETVEDRKKQKAEYLKNNPEKRKETRKKYLERNKDEINRKERERYANNIEKEKARKAEKVVCECGSEVCKGGLSEHRKTQKHEDLMEQLEQLILEDEGTNIEEPKNE